MRELPPNILFDCALLPSNTIFVHREDVHETESNSKSSTWITSEVDDKEYKDGLKVNKRENEIINLRSISVYQLDCTAHVEHKLSEPGSNGCYVVDLSKLPNFFIVADAKIREGHFFKKGVGRDVKGLASQHLNLFPKWNIPVTQAWSEFNSAPWNRCWCFEQDMANIPVGDEDLKVRAGETAMFLMEYDKRADTDINAKKEKLKCIELLMDLQSKCDKFFYHIIAWLDRMNNIKLQDIATEFSNTKSSLRNAANAIKQRELGWDWEPAKTALTDYFTACILLAYFGGIPEQSKNQKDGTLQGWRGRGLNLGSLAEAAGMPIESLSEGIRVIALDNAVSILGVDSKNNESPQWAAMWFKEASLEIRMAKYSFRKPGLMG